ncbi:MAG TPA: SDR family NAD(P)-dependent oxidoreductase [Capsulimonadaceae bacterium]|nr:SDR family NAD(P)-dependent oxidoreductase [Capsulimonadaceae bacterium]
MFLSLANRSAIVTGGAQSIGFAIAERLARAGARVLIADIDAQMAHDAARRLTELGSSAIAVPVDLTQPDSAEFLTREALKAVGGIDILVNNAGITGGSGFLWEQTDENWARVLDLNLTAVFRLCRAVIGPMREKKSGAIVNIASIAGKEGNPTLIPYSVSKAGVIALTKALAKEVALEGIRVNCVSPAVIETPLLAQMSQETVNYMTSKIPMARMGKPEEVAAVVHFLASDDASFVTGQCYDISGGRATY